MIESLSLIDAVIPNVVEERKQAVAKQAQIAASVQSTISVADKGMSPCLFPPLLSHRYPQLTINVTTNIIGASRSLSSLHPPLSTLPSSLSLSQPRIIISLDWQVCIPAPPSICHVIVTSVIEPCVATSTSHTALHFKCTCMYQHKIMDVIDTAVGLLCNSTQHSVFVYLYFEFSTMCLYKIMDIICYSRPVILLYVILSICSVILLTNFYRYCFWVILIVFVIVMVWYRCERRWSGDGGRLSYRDTCQPHHSTKRPRVRGLHMCLES